MKAADTVMRRGILMIDAPTGSGKSSLIIPLLAAGGDKKIIVAVRTNSQLEIFLNELQRVRQEKCPSLRFTYILGKQKICPLFEDTTNIFNKCKKVQRRTKNLLAMICDKYPGVDPLRTQEYRDEIKFQEESGDWQICPYYASTYAPHPRSLSVEDESEKILVAEAAEKIHELSQVVIPYQKIKAFSGKFCPHALLWQSLKDSQVIVLNYHYLLRSDIGNLLLKSIEKDPGNVILLLDEAHNIGEVLKSIQKISFVEKTLDKAEDEFKDIKNSGKILKGLDTAQRMLNVLRKEFDTFICSNEKEKRILPEQIIQDMLLPNENLSFFFKDVAEMILAHGVELDDDDFPLAHAYNFCLRLSRIKDNSPYYVSFYRNDDKVKLELLYLDPEEEIREFVQEYHAAVLASGTFNPLEAYKAYYFGDLANVELHRIPNTFPKENRLILRAEDITSRSSDRYHPCNIEKIQKYINLVCSLPGNVAVFFPSYEYMNKFYASSKESLRPGKKIFLEDTNGDKAALAVKEFMELPANGGEGVLFGVCGGKWCEGLDFKGDLLNAAFVVGYPLSLINDYQRTMNSWFTSKFHDKKQGEFIAYRLPAYNKTVQALGRVLRTETDVGILILGDDRYRFSSDCNGLPEWMRGEMISCTVETASALIEKWRR